MSYQSFEELDVWKNGCRLAVSVHSVFKNSKDTIRFLHIAKGSVAELRTQLYLSVKMEIVSNDQIEGFITVAAQLQSLINYLKTCK